ncbi:MAG: c-type cytochrome [Mariprofundus sp.]
MMMRCALLLLVLLAPAVLQAADAERGAVVAKVRCLPCHHLHSEWKRIGPGLKGIYGRAPTITGVPFTVWDDAALELWLSGPRKIKPNTRMSMPPIAATDRADLIAYFKQDVRQGANLPSPEPFTAKKGKQTPEPF